MFAMIAVAFVVLTGHERRGAELGRRVDQTADPPDRCLDQAFRVVVRGSNSPASAIKSLSLLEKIYGNESLGTIAAPKTMINPLVLAGADGQVPQLIEFEFETPSKTGITRRVGAVLTMLDGPAAGLSTRIVGLSPAYVADPTQPPRVQILAFEKGVVPLAGDHYIVGGIPYSGMGMGYIAKPDQFNTAIGEMSAVVEYDPTPGVDDFKVPAVGSTNAKYAVALMPNQRLNWDFDPNIQRQGPAGGANCDYTAPDYQDPLLAFQVPDAPQGAVHTPIPSLHRPEVVAFSASRFATPIPPGQRNFAEYWLDSPEHRAVLRKITCRPMGQIATTHPAPLPNPTINVPPDHPSFTGSNPAVTATRSFDYINGPWDVDNDGDGVPDSVWVDLGFAVRFTADGRAYKPLFAILCVDMDGRLNLNAHGNLAQANMVPDILDPRVTGVNATAYCPTMDGNVVFGSVRPAYEIPSTAAVLAGNPLAGAGPPVPVVCLPRGQGYGPAEINLTPLFRDWNSASAYPQNYGFPLYQNLLVGNKTLTVPLCGRYGELAVLDTTLVPPRYPQPGVSVTLAAAVNINNMSGILNFAWMAPHTYNKWCDYSGNYWSYRNDTTNYWFDGYGSPPDPQGFGAVGVDTAGRPLYMTMGLSLSKAISLYNTPYDLDLSRVVPQAAENSPTDSPFSPAELERILRPYDRDTPTLPQRLATLTATIAGNPQTSMLIPKRYAVTTESSNVPCPGTALPAPLQATVKNKGAFDPQHPPMVRDPAPTGTNPVPDPEHPGELFRPRHMGDLLMAKILAHHNPGGTPPDPALTAINDHMALLQRELLSPEMLAGLKLNLNRPLCNWRQAAGGHFQLFDRPNNLWSDATDKGFNPDPLGSLDSTGNPRNSIVARQMQARYLYVLGLLLWDAGQLQPLAETLTSAQQDELMQRRIAQWAINVVCYSTSDSIMVPFKYNIDPFKVVLRAGRPTCWTAEMDGTAGYLATPNKDLDATAPKDCGVVWGCKPPELLLTETLAFHDRRVADTTWVQTSPGSKKRTDTTNADPTLDQTRIPQGSAFFEVYCPRNPRNAAAPMDLFTPVPDLDPSARIWCLNLSQLAKEPTVVGSVSFYYPVWRLVIGRSGANNNVAARLANKPNSTSLEPEQCRQNYPGKPAGGTFSLLNVPADPDVQIERIVWFAAQPPKTTSATVGCQYDPDLVYYNRAAVGSNVYLPAGQYLTVGPRAVTYVGSLSSGLGSPSPQRIALRPNMGFIPTSGTSTYPSYAPADAKIQMPLSIIAGGGGKDTGWPTGWNVADPNNPVTTNGIGISISEPLFSDPTNYYPQPHVPDLNLTDPITSKKIIDWYGDPNQVNTDPGATPPGGYFLDEPLDTVAGRPLRDDNLLVTHTQVNYKTVFLQRLANPWAAYDPIKNPYRTVDWMPIDLTVFNGEDKPVGWEATPRGMAGEPWDQDPNNWTDTDLHFQARQRGRVTVDPAHYGNNALFNIWAQTSEDLSASIVGTSGSAVFNYDLQHTLGYLNKAFCDPTPATTPGRTTAWITKADNVSDSYVGDPWDLPDPADPTKRIQWPWLTWSGRPYVSELELPLVPASPSGRLLWEFGMAGPANIYSPYVYPAGALTDPFTFPHLLNFFQSQFAGVNYAPNVQRLLDYVGVPSRFVGTDVEISPISAINNPSVFGNPLVHAFHPPFNRISTYREPGRINLNTISSPEVFYGLMNYFPGMATPLFWNKFIQSRRGYGITGTFVGDRQLPFGMADYNTNSPTCFVRPFRGSSAAAMQPLLAGVPEVDSTVFRSADPTAATPPLFEFHPAALRDPVTGLKDPTVATPTPDITTADKSIAILGTNRNAYFRYQGIERLGNLVTTRSNVFAVWITVGYFEVLPNSAPGSNGRPDAAHPDGYELGQELGVDTGDTVRHRAFYLYDRSIPVGFQRGQDLNQDKATLLRRYIE